MGPARGGPGVLPLCGTLIPVGPPYSAEKDGEARTFRQGHLRSHGRPGQRSTRHRTGAQPPGHGGPPLRCTLTPAGACGCPVFLCSIHGSELTLHSCRGAELLATPLPHPRHTECGDPEPASSRVSDRGSSRLRARAPAGVRPLGAARGREAQKA